MSVVPATQAPRPGPAASAAPISIESAAERPKHPGRVAPRPRKQSAGWGTRIFALTTVLALAAGRWWRDDLDLTAKSLTELAGDLVNGTLNAEQFEQARADLERSLLQDIADGGAASPRVPGVSGSGRWAALLVAFAVPIAALGFYYATGDHATGVGQPAAQNIAPDGQAEAGAAAGQMHPVEQMLTQLTQRLAKQPQDGEGWALAGRTYAYLHRYAEAVLAYEKAAKLLPPDPQLLADYADALAAVGGKGLAGKPTELVQQALVLDPNHPKALWLAGTAAFDLGNY